MTTVIRYLNRDVYTSGLVLSKGDRVEVGDEAANPAYVKAYRVQRFGEEWKALGPFAVIAKGALL